MSKVSTPYIIRVSQLSTWRHPTWRHSVARRQWKMAEAMLQQEQRMLAMSTLVKVVFQHLGEKSFPIGDAEIPDQTEDRPAVATSTLRGKIGFGMQVSDWDSLITSEDPAKELRQTLFLKELSNLNLLELPTEGSSDDDDGQAAFWTEANLMALATMAKERAASLEETHNYVQANCVDALRR